jgi:hypothetical protein
MHAGEISQEQHQLWARCEALWKLTLRREGAPVRAALHPDYSGWVTGTAAPHDREAAIASIGPASPRVLAYELTPLAVRVFEGQAGVIHYSYIAEVESAQGRAENVSGRWSEVYLRSGEGEWIMIAVSGGPDGQR